MSEHFRLRDLFPNAIFSKINTADFFVGSCHDTRHLLNKEIFVCLKGTNNHGIDYAQEAMHKGAIGILIDYEHEYLFDGPKIIVEDVQSALRHAVQKIRQNYHHKIIAVTGSAGKTSTKEYYRQICPDKNACISYGNWNNLLGLMINLSRLSNFSPYNFFELGISQMGEMDVLVDLLQPDIVFITSIGAAHLEGLHSCEVIANEKMKIGKYALEKYCSEQASQWLTKDWKVISCSDIKKNFDIEKNQFETFFKFNALEYHVSSNGFLHENLLCFSIFILSFLDLKISNNFRIQVYPGRGNFIRKKNLIIVNDTYNCNALSLISLAENISIFENSVLVIGDLAELGSNEEQHIIQLKNKLSAFKNVRCFYFGKMKDFWIDENIIELQSIKQINHFLIEFKSKLIAFKASRSSAIEKLMEEFINQYELL